MIIRRLGAFFLDILQVIVFAVSIFLFVYLLILQPHKIKGSSMETNFHDGEFILTDKLSYRFGEPKRGDVVVFKAPPDGSQEFIKRILGLPGEKAEVREGYLFVNNHQVEEKYLGPGVITHPSNFAAEGKPFIVPQGQYFVMGDNRDHSYDSRSFGLLDKSKITGRAWIVYWPPKDMGVVHGPSYNF